MHLFSVEEVSVVLAAVSCLGGLIQEAVGSLGGRGILLGGVPGIPRGEIIILGGGVVGTNACKVALGLGANVTILDISHKRLSYLDDIFPRQITTLYSNENNIRICLEKADVVIGVDPLEACRSLDP